MKKIAAVLMLATALGGCRNAAPTYDHAATLVEKGDLGAARVELMNLLQKSPGDVRALALMARVQLAGGDGVGAENTLKQLAAKQALTSAQRGQMAEALMLQDRCDRVDQMKDPASGPEADVLRIRISCAIAAGDSAKAGTLVALAESRFADNGPLTVIRGRYAVARGDFAAARSLSALAIERLPKDFDAALLGGQVALIDGDYTRALSAFDRAAKLNPVSLAPLFAKGLLLAELNRKPELDALIARAEKIGANRGEVHLLKGESAFLAGDMHEAQNEATAARKILAGNPSLRMLEARIAMKQGNDGIAVQQLAQLVRSQPGYARARLLLAEAQFKTGDAKAAAETLRPAAMLPNAPRAYVAAMATYAKAAKLPDADAFAARAQYPSPARLADALVEADAAMQRRDWQGAALRYEALLTETGQPNAVMLNNLGWAQFELGQHDKAVATLKKAVDTAPDNASARDSYGWVLWKSGKDKAGGIAQLRKAATLAPDNKAIAAHLSEASARPN